MQFYSILLPSTAICSILMPRIFIPVQLRDLTSGQAEIEVEGATVGETVAALERRFPGFKQRVCQGEELAPNLQISVNGTFTRRGLDARVQPASEVHFLPVFGGG